jgi:hypothetical protein
LLALNTAFFSSRYQNLCGTSTETPALDELAWISSELKQARATGERVWLLMHIPPGLDSFASASSLQQNGPPVILWQQELTSRFLQLVEEYRATIQSAFASHMHRDDFRLIRLHGKPVLAVKIAPSISPIYANNPGFHIIEYERASAVIRNYQTVYLTDLAARAQKPSAAGGHWAEEYDFRKTYGFAALDGETVWKLAEGIERNSQTRQHYMNFYDVGAAPDMTVQTLEVFRCAMVCITPAEFQACRPGFAQPSPAIPAKSTSALSPR